MRGHGLPSKGGALGISFALGPLLGLSVGLLLGHSIPSEARHAQSVTANCTCHKLKSAHKLKIAHHPYSIAHITQTKSRS